MVNWKKLKGYTNYSVSTDGQIRNDKTGRIYKTWLDSNGYPSLHLGKDIRRVHKLVAETFIENPLNLPEVNHIDGNKQNNHKPNLEWCTHSENILHSRRVLGKKYTRNRGLVECVETGEIYLNATVAAKAVNRSLTAIRKCLKGQTKTCAGLHWRYYHDNENRSNPGGEGYDLWLCKKRWDEYFGVPEEESVG